MAGAIEVIGWQFRLSTSDIDAAAAGEVGFVGIAVALLGRNTAVGVFFAALLFGALLNGTSTRNLEPEVFQPSCSSLTLLIGTRRALRRRRHHRAHRCSAASGRLQRKRPA